MKKQLQAYAAAHKYDRAFASEPMQDITVPLQNMIKQYPKEEHYHKVLEAADKKNPKEILQAVFQGVIEGGMARKDQEKPSENSEITYLLNAVKKNVGAYTDKLLREDEGFLDTFKQAGKYVCVSQEKSLFENTLKNLENSVEKPVNREASTNTMSRS